MTTKPSKDFSVDTMGRCFLCSKPASDTHPETPVHSLQYLSRYLRMDLSKVFQIKGLIQQSLLDKVIKSQLKASLCEMCISLNEKISELCQKLDKIQVGVMHCLELVKDHLEGAIASTLDNDLSTVICSTTDNNSEDGKWTLSKMEIVEALRKEAVQKCNRKLRSRIPQIKIQKLTSPQVYKEQTRIRSSCRTPVKMEPISMSASYHDTEPQVEIGCMKQEPPVEALVEWQDEWPEVEEGISSDPLEEPLAKRPRIEKQANQQKNETIDKHSKKLDIPPPIKIQGIAGTSTVQSSINPTTGRFRCRQCSKEYVGETSFIRHYDRAHLQIKYLCPICNREFFYQQQYQFHYLAKHANFRHECVKCHKTFAWKQSLRNHELTTHLSKEGGAFGDSAYVPPPVKVVGRVGKPASDINQSTGMHRCLDCQLEFETYLGLDRHYRVVHLNERYSCPLCSKDFTRKVWYNRHYLSSHLGVSSKRK